jgi:hypothetical protein
LASTRELLQTKGISGQLPFPDHRPEWVGRSRDITALWHDFRGAVCATGEGGVSAEMALPLLGCGASCNGQKWNGLEMNSDFLKQSPALGEEYWG